MMPLRNNDWELLTLAPRLPVCTVFVKNTLQQKMFQVKVKSLGSRHVNLTEQVLYSLVTSTVGEEQRRSYDYDG